MSPASRPAPLVAREQTLQELWLQVAASADQGMRAAAVRGPAGSGKTRVLDAFAERARGAGATVIAGRAPSLGGHPYATLADALAGYVRGSAPAGGQIRRAGEALARLVPALVALDGDPASGPPEALAVVQAAYRLVRQVTERRPLVLIVDDAHLADPDTCELLAALQRHAADLPWTIVLGWRDPSEQVRPAARQLLELLRRDRDCVELTLEPLGRGAAGELIAALLGGGLPAPSLVDMVHTRSAGNPYYLLEMVRWLRASGRLRRAGLQWMAVPGSEDELPPTLEEALRARTATLPREARTVLMCLATAGGGADLNLLAAVTGLSAETLAGVLDGLVAAGLVVEGGGRRAEYRVHHPLVGECLYREMSTAHRRLTHRALGRILAERGEPPGVVAEHLVRAADPGDAEALRAALAAAADAEARTNFSQAVTWFEEALELVTGPDDPTRLHVLDRLSELAGHAGRIDLGRTAIEELLARTAPDDQLQRVRLLRRQASLRIVDGDVAGARAAIEKGLSLGAGGGPEAAALLAELAMVAEITMSVPEILEIVARGHRAAAEAGARAPALVLRAFEAISVADCGEPARGLEIALSAAREAADAQEVLAFGYNAFAAGMCNFLLGRFGEAEQSVRGFVEVSEDAGLLWGAAWLWSLLSQAQLYQGDFAASLASGLRAEELGRRPGAASVMPMPMVFVAEVLVAQGRLAEAEERLDEARRWQEDRPNKFANAWYFFGLGWLRDAQGRHGEAADAYAEMAARFEARGQQAQIGLKPELAHALIRAGRPDRALVVAREVVATIAGRDMPMGQATASAALAAALSACGHHAEGVTEARRAVELGDGVDGGLFAARARAVLGEALLRAGERVEACDVLRDAHQRLAALPLVPDRDRVAALLAELGFTSPRPVRPAPADGGPSRAGPLDDLSRRERDVVELAVTGVSSRSIALRLGLSERTVENHLQRTYVKLGVHSRAELIALVAGTASAAAG